MEKQKRVGAKSQKDLEPDILNLLNQGVIESANLTEWLCVEHKTLVRAVLPLKYQKNCVDKINELKSKSTMAMIKAIGEALYTKISEESDDTLFELLKTHSSDSVRCWAVYIVGANSQLSIIEKLKEVEPFAADSHFGVREIAWMSVRDDITQNLEEALDILTHWSMQSDANIRRFACESIRPNGVWCKKIDRLKTNPELALSILENLKSDSSKYVQDSVGNWLNDASKTCPLFVSDLCTRWQTASPTKETNYIVKRALRTLNK